MGRKAVVGAGGAVNFSEGEGGQVFHKNTIHGDVVYGSSLQRQVDDAEQRHSYGGRQGQVCGMYLLQFSNHKTKQK